MTIRSMSVSLVAAVLTMGTTLPASAQVTAVPREGVAFNETVTQRVKIETVDPDDRTVAFTLADGQVLVLPVDNRAGNLAAIADGSTANVTYTQVVTMLNLRQKARAPRKRAATR